MDKVEFIRQFIEENGYLPDEDTIQEMFPTPISRNPHQISFLGPRRQRARGEDLLGEVKGIFGDIAGFARISAKKRGIRIETPWATEFGYMALIFVAKAGLYFVLQSSYRDGYDFSNL